MPTTATRIESEILEHEKQFWEASKGDGRKLGELCASDFTFVMAEGITNFKRKEFVDMLTAGDYKLKSFKIDEGKAIFRELSPGAATVAYEAKSEFELGGKAQKADSFYTSTWVKEGDSWKCALVTESAAAK